MYVPEGTLPALMREAAGGGERDRWDQLSRSTSFAS